MIRSVKITAPAYLPVELIGRWLMAGLFVDNFAAAMVQRSSR